ncbi:MAG: lipopolysaccharide biosynthesis protein [Bilophila wadsworthia]
MPSKRPMTEERESAPNQAPDTDQATHQRPPQASLARRYMGKLLANIATVPVYLIMEAVLPRALGPQVYGNFNFSTSVFTQLTGFLDMGTSTCFYNALSRRQYEMSLVAFYGRVSALVFLVTMLAGVFLLVPGLGDMLLPDVPLWYAPLAAFYGFLLWGTRVVRSMNDALGLTVPGELLRSGVNLLGAIIILALFWFGFLNAGSLFGLQYLMMGSIVIGCLAIMRRSWAHIDLSLTRDQRLSYTREFSDYSMPLFVQALLSALALSAERWVLQWFDGSTQQGYFALSQRVSAACFLFVSAMTPLIMRELAIAWGKDDREHMGHLLTRFAPLLFGIAAWFPASPLWKLPCSCIFSAARSSPRRSSPCRSWPCIRPIRLTGNWQAPFSMPPARPRYCGTLPLSSTSEASSSYGCWSRRRICPAWGSAQRALPKTVTTQFIMVNLLFWMASRLIPLNFFRNLMPQGSSSARSSESHGSANRRRGFILRMTPIKSYASSSPASSTPSCPSGSWSPARGCSGAHGRISGKCSSASD